MADLQTVVPQPPAAVAIAEEDRRCTQSWLGYFQQIRDTLVSGLGGVFDGSDAGSGVIGEYQEATTASAVALTTATPATLTTLDLPAGDWDVTGWVDFQVAAGSAVDAFSWGIDALDTSAFGATVPADFQLGVWAGTKRRNGSAVATVELQAAATFTGTIAAVGRLQARRVR